LEIGEFLAHSHQLPDDPLPTIAKRVFTHEIGARAPEATARWSAWTNESQFSDQLLGPAASGLSQSGSRICWLRLQYHGDLPLLQSLRLESWHSGSRRAFRICAWQYGRCRSSRPV